MPEIMSGESEVGKTLAVGFWEGELCDNSLALFPAGEDCSWGEFSFEIDGCDSNNYAEMQILDGNKEILKVFKYTTNGRKELDLSQYTEISATTDVHPRVKVQSYI